MKKVVTVCPYCASGCKINLVVDNGKIVRAEAAQGKTNQGTLCLKGYYGWDFINDTQILTPRLKTPMIRRQRGGKLEAVSWDEALDYVATRLSAIKAKYGPDAIQTTGSSRGTGNETNYVMQKFARAVLNTNNVDCCARVCHGPSVAGLQQALGNGAMSNSISDIENSKCLLVFGYNCADSHPIVARRVIKARDNGAKIIVCDPRRIETARIADRHLQLNNGSNMALVNAFGYVLLEEELYNKTYVERYTEGLDAYREAVKDYAPEAVEGIVGVSAREIREAMRMFAAAHPPPLCGAWGSPSLARRWTWCAAWQAWRCSPATWDGPTSAWGRSAGKTTYRAPAIWACCRTCSPAIRRSPTPPCGRNSPPPGASTRR